MKITQVTYNVVDVYELEEVIRRKYSEAQHVDLICSEEWDDNTQHVYNIDGELSKWDIQELADILLHDHYGSYGTARRFLNALCKDKVIEPGNYLIKVPG